MADNRDAIIEVINQLNQRKILLNIVMLTSINICFSFGYKLDFSINNIIAGYLFAIIFTLPAFILILVPKKYVIPFICNSCMNIPSYWITLKDFLSVFESFRGNTPQIIIFIIVVSIISIAYYYLYLLLDYTIITIQNIWTTWRERYKHN